MAANLVNPGMLNDTPKSNAELARALGVSPPMVHKLKGRGMPVHSLRAAIEWRAKNLNPAQRKDSGGHSPAVNDQPPSGGRFRVANDESFDQARTRKEIALADQAEMEADERRSSLVAEAKVRAEFARQISAAREAILQLPARLAPVLAAERSLSVVQQTLEVELRQALDQFTATV